jgi:hypothetical protein
MIHTVQALPSPRVAAMLAWLADHAAEVDALKWGSVSFHFDANGSLVVKADGVLAVLHASGAGETK